MRNLSYSRPTKAIIDRAAFQNNIRVIQNHCPNSDLILVIKANAYGHGMVEMARLAQDNDLAVAIPEELMTLRKAGIENRVWVLQGFFNERFLSEPNVVWVVHSLWQLEFLQSYMSLNPNQHFDLCLKIDSGMHRLGFSVPDFEKAIRFLQSESGLNIFATMTHFANSDEPQFEDVRTQTLFFDNLLNLHQLGNIRQTLSNSGAICFYPETHRNWVRPGIMLYGGSPSDNASLPIPIEAVMTFKSAIVALHEIKAGEGVGYGYRWIADRDSLIATVAVGYADGYPRHAPNKTPVGVFVNQELYITGLVGRVSMDMITIDVTEIPDVAIGDSVELWGKHISANLVAKMAGTISYQLFTSIGSRVEREIIN